MYKKFIYLASPYSDPDPKVVEDRVRRVSRITAQLIQQGHLVFSPIVYSHPLKDLIDFDPFNFGWVSQWMDFDTAMLADADELWILKIPGWESSRGCDLEMTYALDHGIPIHFVDPAEFNRGKTIIGLSGHAGAGKDSVGRILVDQGYVRVSLADGVREAVYRLNPECNSVPVRNIVDLFGWEKAKREAPAIRELLQVMGSEVGRAMFGNDCWIKRADRKIEALPNTAKVVITDIRFPNEALWVRKMGGAVVNVVRPGIKAVNDHASEVALPDNLIDATLDNDGTLDDLVGRVNDVCQNL